MVDLAKVGSEELKPYFEKNRHACPFYGFHMAFEGFNAMIDQSGNQCALIKDSYSPCQMEIQNLAPCWKKCSFATSDNIDLLNKIEKIVIVFPDEFRPPGAKSWRGITMKQWIEYMKNKEAS